MKNRLLSFLASIALLSLASCTDEVQELAGEQSQVLKQIVMTTQDFQPEADSRTVYQVADGAVKCTWAENDTVGVFPDKGGQVYFPMISGAGTKNASFDGEGWALKDGRTYGAYYPFIADILLDRNAVPVSYTGQKQVGNGSMAHLGDYDYMVAAPTAPEFGSAQFMFKHLSALVQLKITVPQPATLTSVKLVTENNLFFVEGEVDLMETTPSIAPITPVNEVELALQDISTTQANQEVMLYMMIPPTNLKAQTLKAIFQTDKGKEEVVLDSKNFQSGTIYLLSGEMESTEAGYKDGVVTIAEAGTMKQLLGDDWLNITSLKVVGPINGDDVLCLRQMLGGIEFDNTEKGKLTTLDLSEAKIVEGGGAYYTSHYAHYTINDVIGDYMFYYCHNPQNMVLPVGVTSIGYQAFDNCTSLSSIGIPASVTSIGEGAFVGCTSLTSIDIPAGVTSIGDRAFLGCPFISIDIPAGVTSIGESVFSHCSSLTSIDIPAGVTSIGESAFEGCTSLKSIDIPAGVTSIGESAFCRCSSLKSIDIPAGVTSIGESAFEGCTSLMFFDIPNGVTSIGAWAFKECSSLTSIDIPAGVTLIERAAFEGCSSLKSVYITDVSAWYKIIFSNTYSNPLNGGAKLYLNNNELTELVVPADINEIKNYAFYGCESIKKLTLGAHVTLLGVRSFRNCSSLAQVYCQGITPPVINSSFDGPEVNRTLYVPAGCISTYQSSDWAGYFMTIEEME